MAGMDRCPKCGAMVLPQENFCPQCGAPLTGAQPEEEWVDAGTSYERAGEEGWQPDMTPATIDQLQAYCQYHGMPLEKMRFFVGEDYRQPRAFGIYREGDRFVVYKNKSDGSRAVRYNGPDEAHAVGELYAKLLDECHRRSIWPGGKPEAQVRAEKKAKRRFIILVAVAVVAILGISFFVIREERLAHEHDGYYRFEDDAGLYYHYGPDWYYYDDYYDWVLMDTILYGDDYTDYYIGDDYDADWGYSDFEKSATWESIQEERRTSSSDYDSWDAGDTDWDSDW